MGAMRALQLSVLPQRKTLMGGLMVRESMVWSKVVYTFLAFRGAERPGDYPMATHKPWVP
eukprot:2483908-Pleurochrysis_carterae.AAC.2